MSKKETFIKEIEDLISSAAECQEMIFEKLSEDAQNYFDALRNDAKEKRKFTENGKIILKYVQENKENYNNLFKARDIAEGLGISSRMVSGAMRKLIIDGYFEKLGESPVIYSLTEDGKNINIEEEN